MLRRWWARVHAPQAHAPQGDLTAFRAVLDYSRVQSYQAGARDERARIEAQLRGHLVGVELTYDHLDSETREFLLVDGPTRLIVARGQTLEALFADAKEGESG